MLVELLDLCIGLVVWVRMLCITLCCTASSSATTVAAMQHCRAPQTTQRPAATTKAFLSHAKQEVTDKLVHTWFMTRYSPPAAQAVHQQCNKGGTTAFADVVGQIEESESCPARLRQTHVLQHCAYIGPRNGHREPADEH